MPKKDSTTTESPKKENVRLQARHAAVSLLIEENRARFEELMVQESKARGIEYTPELTAEQKAQRTIEDLIAANPSLEESLRQRYSGGWDGTVVPDVPDAPAPGDPAL